VKVVFIPAIHCSTVRDENGEDIHKGGNPGGFLITAKSLFAFARLGVAAFPGFFQRDCNRLSDRFLLRRGMAAAYRSFLFPLIHQRLDIAADDCLACPFF